jgi:hypothetical protein
MRRAANRSTRSRGLKQTLANDFPAASVKNDGEVAKADGYADVREVGRPYHIGSRRDHVAIDVRVNRRTVVAIRRANIPLASVDPEAVDPHNAGDTLVVDQVTSLLMLVCYASVSVAGQFVLDIFDDCNEFRIPMVQSSRS